MRPLLLVALLTALVACDPATPDPPPPPPPPTGSPATAVRTDAVPGLPSGSWPSVISGDRVIGSQDEPAFTLASASSRDGYRRARSFARAYGFSADGAGGAFLTTPLDPGEADGRRFVARLDADLNVRWQKVYATTMYGSQVSEVVAGKAAVVGLTEVTGLDAETGAPLWSLRFGTHKTVSWQAVAADAGGVTVFGTDTASGLLWARIAWDGTVLATRAAPFPERYVAVLSLGRPITLPGGDVLLPYSVLRYSGSSGVLRITPDGTVADSWTFQVQVQLGQYTYYPDRPVPMTLHRLADGQILVEDRRMRTPPPNTLGMGIAYYADAQGNRVGDLLHLRAFYPMADGTFLSFDGRRTVYGRLDDRCTDASTLQLDVMMPTDGFPYQLAPTTLASAPNPVTAATLTMTITDLPLDGLAAPEPTAECNALVRPSGT